MQPVSYDNYSESDIMALAGLIIIMSIVDNLIAGIYIYIYIYIFFFIISLCINNAKDT